MNIRDMVAALIGCLGLAAIGVTAMVTIEHLRPDGHNTQLDTEVIAVLTLMVGQLLSHLRQMKIEKKVEIVGTEANAAAIGAARNAGQPPPPLSALAPPPQFKS